MKIVNPNSLAATLDAVNEVFFLRHSFPKSEREQIAQWIASRQGKPGSYANMFAPTENDIKKGVKLFTGERVQSGAAIRHILGEEACRALILLDVSTVGVHNALKRASRGMTYALSRSKRMPGMYCCGICSCSLWRHLAVGGLEDGERRLAAGMKTLKLHRIGDGKWRRFPFYYTLLALSEIDLPSATWEMRYASSICEQYLKRSRKDNKITQRRRLLAKRILEKC